MHRGYIKIYRKLSDNELWTSEKFTRGQAWIDMIMLANHKDGFIRVRGIRVPVLRGQCGWSEVSLAGRWRWSRGKVRRFLKELKMMKNIEQQKNRVTSIITIVNYDLYQPDGTTDGTTDGQQTDNKRYTNKNVKNEKNDKNKAESLKTLSCPYQKITDLFHTILPTLHAVTLDETLKKRIRARWNADKQRQSVEWWEWYFKGVSECDFLMGKKTDFAATLHWLTGPQNMSKVLNGQYLNRKPLNKNQAAGQTFLERLQNEN